MRKALSIFFSAALALAMVPAVAFAAPVAQSDADASLVTQASDDQTEAMYRLYNPNSGEHFYTSSTVERDSVIAAGWDDEGIGWTAPIRGIQVYRLYNPFAGEHHYTTSPDERDMLVEAGWNWEEGGWLSDPDKAVPLYRAYNPNAYANNHHYTTDWGEFQTLLSLGWQDEGIGWYGVGPGSGDTGNGSGNSGNGSNGSGDSGNSNGDSNNPGGSGDSGTDSDDSATIYVVTFDGNGGTMTGAVQRSVKKGSALGDGPMVTRDGYDFTGWFTSPHGGNQYTSSTLVNSDVKLFAGWKLKVTDPDEKPTYRVQFDANGGSGTMSPISYYRDTTYSLPRNLYSRSGYTFDGWATEQGGAKRFSDGQQVSNLGLGGSTITLYARWKANTTAAAAAFAAAPQAAASQDTSSLSDAVVAPIPSVTYTGAEIKPDPAVTLDGKRLVKGVDYSLSYASNIDATERATVIIEGMGSYTGRKYAYFTIERASITDADVTANPAQYTYDGTEKTPGVTVNLGGKTLQDGPDYYVYPVTDNVNVGTKVLHVYGEGNYSGTKPVAYTITPAQLSSVSLSETRLTYTGFWQEPKLTVMGAGKVLEEWTDYTVSYPNDCTSVGTKHLVITGCKNFTGTLEAEFEIVPEASNDPSNPVATQVMYRAYNPNSGEHFYTAHYAEVESVVAAGWQYEGEAWTAPVTSATPVYRLYSGTDHHYTTSVVERDHLMSVGWSDEGIGWYSDDNEAVGLHRLFNPNVDPSAPTNNSGSHHYTTSEVERDHLVSIGWRYEDFGWYGVK